MHGGKSTGAPPEKLKGNTNRATPGSPRSKYLDAGQQKRLTELNEMSDAEIMRRAMLLGMLKAEDGDVKGVNATANAFRAKIIADDREKERASDKPIISDEPLSEDEWEAEYGNADASDLEATEGAASGTG